MATSFNATLFKHNLKRFWPLAAAAFLAALLLFIVPELSQSRYSYMGTPDYKDILSTVAWYCAVFAPVFSILTAIAVYGYLHKPRDAGFVSSLPVTRLGLYITNWLSGFALILTPVLLIGVFYGFLLIGQPVPFWDFVKWVCVLIASHMFFFTLASFCAFLTGNPIMHAFLFALINFLCITLYGIGEAVVQILAPYGYFINASFGSETQIFDFIFWLTPPVAIIGFIMSLSRELYVADTSSITQSLLPTIWPWIIYLGLTAALFYFGYRLYKRRHIEDAGNVIIHKPIQTAFKYLMGFLFGVLLSFIFISALFWGSASTSTGRLVLITVSTIVFGSLGCVFSEMILRKTLRVWRAVYKTVIIFSMAIIVATVFVRIAANAYERHVPDAGDVVSVSFTTDYARYSSPLHGNTSGRYFHSGPGWVLSYTYTQEQRTRGLPVYNDAIINEIKQRTDDFFESPEAISAAIKLHQALVDSKSELESLQGYRYGWGMFYLVYSMKDGSTMTRAYVLPVYDEPEHFTATLLLELYNQPEAVHKRTRFNSLSDEALQWVMIQPTSNSRWLPEYCDTTYYCEKHDIIIENNYDFTGLIQALKLDTAAGKLGPIRREDLTYDSYNYRYRTDILGVFHISLDNRAAGIPAAFENEGIWFGFEHDQDRRGYVLTIVVYNDCVNLIEWGMDLFFQHLD